MRRSRKRLAVLADVALSSFQEEIRLGISRYISGEEIDAIFFGIGTLNPAIRENMLQLSFLDLISSDEFDGIVIVSTSLINRGGKEGLSEKLRSLSHIPMISIGPSMIGEPSIRFDNAYGMSLMMQHLIQVHGYTRLAYVSGPLSNAESAERYNAYARALEQARIPLDENYVYEGNFTTSSGYDAVKEYFDVRKCRPEVIICANDHMAIGAWSALKDRAVNVPFDICVTGYDGFELSQILPHYFTTVRQSFQKASYIAAKNLHMQITGKQPARSELLKAELFIGNTCGCVDIKPGCPGIESSRSGELSDPIKSRIIAFLKKDFSEDGRRDIMKMWSETLLSFMQSRISLYGLEEVISECRNIIADSDTDGKKGLFLINLNDILQKERIRTYYADHFMQRGLSARLREATADLHESMIEALSLHDHDAKYQRIMNMCRAEAMHVMMFNDYEDLKKGAHILFSSMPADRKRNWEPREGAWFPEDGKTYVANMIILAEQRFGYFIMSTEVPDPYVFNEIRLHFASLFRHFLIRQHLHSTNSELHTQIEVRENTEKELKEALSMVQQLSMEDPLTGLYNRRGFETLAEQRMKFLERQQRGYYIFLADLDGLKIINDNHGHHEGDIAIKTAAKILRKVLRSSDIISRIGGDEYAMFISDDQEQTCEQIERRIHKECIEESNRLNKKWTLSMSIGHCYVEPNVKMQLSEIIKMADKVLYIKKKQ